jgi:Rrf2 family protein
MASVIHISDAVSIGVHAVLCLSSDPHRNWSTREIVNRYHFSEAHLAKVMACLARAGIVAAVRGPGGGARLRRPPSEVTILEVYEAIDGPMTMDTCLLAPAGCGSTCCQLGPRLSAFNDDIRQLFAKTSLSDLAGQAADAGCRAPGTLPAANTGTPPAAVG